MTKVHHVVADEESLLGSKVQEDLHDCSIWIVLAFFERDEGVQIRLFTFVWVENTPAPKCRSLMRDYVATCHDSKVRLSTTDSAIEIRVLCCVGIDDITRSKDNLEVDYVIACETMFGRENRESTQHGSVGGRRIVCS